MSDDVLRQLGQTIDARRDASGDRSYTRQLLDGGPARCAKKFGEEAVELVIATQADNREAILNEAADVIYHLLVLLASRDARLDDVLDVLARRSATSGLAEKASRSNG